MKQPIGHIRVLQVSSGGKTVDLGVNFAGTTQGTTVEMKSDALNDAAIDFLAAGHAIDKNGGTLGPIGHSIPSTILGCTQLALVSAKSDAAIVCLVMRFGAMEIAVRANAGHVPAHGVSPQPGES